MFFNGNGAAPERNSRIAPGNFVIGFSLACWTQWTFFGVGANEALELHDAGNWLAAVENTVVLFLIGIWLLHAGWWKWTGGILAASLAVLTPMRLMTGEALLTVQNVDTVFGSNVAEAAGFLSTLLPTDFLIPGVAAAGIIFAIGRCAKPIPVQFRSKFQKAGWALPVLLPLVFITSPVGYILYGIDHRSDAATWHVTGTLPDRKPLQNYVLILGESLRSDALAIYGNPYPTTPFLSSKPLKTVDEMVAPSYATMSAVPRLLALSEGEEVQPQNNVVALAREAGFKTYWVSAQGRTGPKDLPISHIAKSADERIFVKRGDDFAMVGELAALLDRAPDQRRLIVLHAYGSHENVCDRLDGVGRPFEAHWGEQLDCYLASALKADQLIERVSGIFRARGETHSILFVSDHAVDFQREFGVAGMSFMGKKQVSAASNTAENERRVRSSRNPFSKQQFVVPFLELGDSVSETQVARTRGPCSAMELPAYMPTWLGLSTNLTPVGKDIFRCGEAGRSITVLNPKGKLTSYGDLNAGLKLPEILRSSTEHNREREVDQHGVF